VRVVLLVDPVKTDKVAHRAQICQQVYKVAAAIDFKLDCGGPFLLIMAISSSPQPASLPTPPHLAY
jgi:hypothetical protein